MQRAFVARSLQNFGKRTFASDAHAPPKKLHGTTGRYAGAVYTSASKAGMLEKVENELVAFSSTLKSSPSFAAFLSNPTIPRGEKAVKLEQLLGEEKKISHITRNLFVTMSANGRIGDASKVVSAFLELMDESRGVLSVVITSAEPLKKKTLESVQASVMAMAGPGKQVQITTKEDPSIIGGLQILVGDKFLDLSVSSRIAEVTSALESSEL
eukprot:CAMPEP_0116933120 /NCGR_PEP_ID=MMETSP0467-20121206/28839_1 /TAXON_ID=283647 /ORGANISM="Mesodinium pulex, Strain SPMC105" /LENGTH=211 /DNA_ID=CAMNT_0004613923 /DNA_START=50 /DNA_END=685 /DNA_ORIENTATION=+